MSYRSHEILQGPGYANVRALYKADGYAEEELKRPIIGIANAYNSICPGHIVLRQMAERIREGIQAAGGMPIEFGTIGACDGIAMGHEGMRYILPAREMIANDVEAMVQAHRLDGIVLLGSCDKIIPGMLIGAMRVNLPAIFINGGPSLPGHMADGKANEKAFKKGCNSIGMYGNGCRSIYNHGFCRGCRADHIKRVPYLRGSDRWAVQRMV